MIFRRVDSGLWEPMYPGIYRLSSFPKTWRQTLLATCFAWGQGAVASHSSAGILWIHTLFAGDQTELTVPRNRIRRYDHVVHRGRLVPSDVRVVDAIPVTSPERTLIDLAGTRPRDVVEEALDDLLRRRLVTIARLQWRLREGGRAHLRGTTALRGLVEARAGAPIPESVFETRMLRLLKNAGLPHPALQEEIRSNDRLIARVDFTYPALKLAIEADGYRWHAGRRSWQRDLARRNALAAAGWHVLHITWEDLTHRPDEVLRTVAQILAERGFRR